MMLEVEIQSDTALPARLDRFRSREDMLRLGDIAIYMSMSIYMCVVTCRCAFVTVVGCSFSSGSEIWVRSG